MPVSPFVSLFSNSGSLYTGSLLPSPSFPVSSDENPALVNPRLCFRPPPYFPFFSCSYNLIYYFAKRHVSFSSATITMYVILLNASTQFHGREGMVKFFLLCCILLSFIFLTIKNSDNCSLFFVKYAASFLNSSQYVYMLEGKINILVLHVFSKAFFFLLFLYFYLIHISLSLLVSLSPSSRKITILRGNSCRSHRQNLIN